MVAGTLKKLLAKCNRSYKESFMQATNITANNHGGPHPGVLAIVYTWRRGWPRLEENDFASKPRMSKRWAVASPQA